jgi:hypothetical protein
MGVTPDLYLGISQLAWLRRPDFDGVKVFVSMNSFDKYKTLPDFGDISMGVDSAGFKKLQMLGAWDSDAEQFAGKCLAVKKHFGPRALWFSPQDWMCEPIIINGGTTKDGVFVGTQLSVEEHQHRTVQNFIELREILGDMVIPVVQGWTVFDYWRCLQMYRDRGIDLTQFERVGVGSVCRRQSTNEAALIMQSIASEIGPRLHGYGFKKDGYRLCGTYMVSGDTFAWSFAGRRRPDETHDHIALSKLPENKGKRGCADDCAQCPQYALEWRADFMRALTTVRYGFGTGQLPLSFGQEPQLLGGGQ